MMRAWLPIFCSALFAVNTASAAALTATVTGKITSVVGNMPAGEELFSTAVGDAYTFSFNYDTDALYRYGVDVGEYIWPTTHQMKVTVGAVSYDFAPTIPIGPTSVLDVFYDHYNIFGSYSNGYTLGAIEDGWRTTQGAAVSLNLLNTNGALGQGPLTSLSLPGLGALDIAAITAPNFSFDYTFSRYEPYADGSKTRLVNYSQHFNGSVDSVVATPLPAGIWLFASGLGFLAGRNFRKAKSKI